MRRSRHFDEGGTGSGGGSWRRRAAGGRLIARIVLAQLVIGALAVTLVTRELGRSPSTPVALKVARPAAASRTSPRPVIHPPPSSTTTTTSLDPAVAPAGQLHSPSAIATLAAPLTEAQLKSVRGQKGVEAVEVVDVGTVGFAGAPAVTLGVDPGTFRDFTPSVTAASDPLWQYIASGTVASSFDMSRDRKLTLGVDVAIAGAGGGATTKHWLGAFMSVGLPGVDLVVGRSTGRALGLTPGSGLIVSAPSVDPLVLQTSLKALTGASVVLMRPGLALGTSGGGTGLVTTAQLSTALTAALSRVGKPYVWGATGPDSFDCSGLVGWSFAAAGVNLPRTAAEQALAGPAVPLNKIQPGDLLFWAWDPADPGFIDHVAIYLGGGKMIEAPFTGAWVHVVAVETSHLVGAVRINPAVAARLGSPWQR